MNARAKKILKFASRWGIAIFGIYYVVSHMSLYDRIMTTNPNDGWPVSLRLTQPASETSQEFEVIDTAGKYITLDRSQLLAKADVKRVTLASAQVAAPTYDVLALKVTADPDHSHWPLVVTRPRDLWQKYWDIHSSPAEEVAPSQISDSGP